MLATLVLVRMSNILRRSSASLLVASLVAGCHSPTPATTPVRRCASRHPHVTSARRRTSTAAPRGIGHDVEISTSAVVDLPRHGSRPGVVRGLLAAHRGHDRGHRSGRARARRRDRTGPAHALARHRARDDRGLPPAPCVAPSRDTCDRDLWGSIRTRSSSTPFAVFANRPMSPASSASPDVRAPRASRSRLRA